MRLHPNSILAYSVQSFVLILLVGCTSTKQVYTEPSPPPPIVVEEQEPEITPKEAEEEIVVEKEPEIIENIKTGPQESVKMTLLIPFNAKNYYPGETKLSPSSERFINFYQGFLLGARQLQNEGLAVSLEVMDTENNEEIFDKKLKSIDPRITDIVIGSYKAANIRKLAAWSRNNQRLAVSPWKSSSSVSTDNPYFLQINPTLDQYFESIVEHAHNHFEADQVIIVGREKEKKRIDKLQNIKRRISQGLSSDTFGEMVIRKAVDSIEYVDFRYNFNSSRTPVVILPYYRNENFVHDFLGKLASIADGRKVIVYGMPNWLNFNSVDYTQLAHLKTRLPCHQYVDEYKDDVARFMQLYYDNYTMVPTHDDAYLGYDIALFVGRSYRDMGSDFLLELDGSEERLSTIWIDVSRNVPNPPAGSEDYDRINFFENKGIHFMNFSRSGTVVTD